MYNKKLIETLGTYIFSLNGVFDKPRLAEAVKKQFNLTKDRSVYYCESFAIRFSKASSRNLSNGIVSLSTLRKFDDAPFIICVVTNDENYLLLANSTMLSKISHSSQQLRIDNIKGTFLGSDIIKNVDGVENSLENFETLFNLHESFTFEENLKRLVENTNGIVPTGRRFEPSDHQLTIVREAAQRAHNFLSSVDYTDLDEDLGERIQKVKNEIAIAALIDNVNVRGRVIEYLITSDGGSLRDHIIECLNDKLSLPEFKTDDGLGDYLKEYKNYSTATEIKTKVLFLNSNPKAYNVDKLLSFLSEPNSIFMIYIVGIDDSGKINSVLCSVFDEQLLAGTNILYQWAGRNSRGVTQFRGKTLVDILSNPRKQINILIANDFVEKMLTL